MRKLNITGYAIEKLNDPFGILTGDRYEYYLDLEVSEDDELYTENGLFLKVLYVVEETGGAKIVNYGLYDSTTEKYIDFALEDDELEIVRTFIIEHPPSE